MEHSKAESEIKRKIDALLIEVSTKIANHDYDGLEDLLSSRDQMVTELISSYADDDTLRNYLNAIRVHDHNMMQVLRDNREAVKKALLKVDRVKDYFL